MATVYRPLSEFLQKSEDWTQPEPDKTYKQITARLWGKGLSLRAKTAGINIVANRQLRASTGQFLISRIDARHGAFGIVPEDLDGALVSNDFPCFDINENVIFPRYLEWYAHTREFIELCRRASEGSTNRVRLKEAMFLATKIPVPPPAEQRRIVAKLNKVAALVSERRRNVEAAQRESQALLLKAFEHVITGAPYRPMAEIAPLIRRPVDVQPDRIYPELGVRSFGRGTFHKAAIAGVEVGSKKLFRIQNGDLLFNIVFAWEGAVAVAREQDNGRVGSHRFLTCVPNPDMTNSNFLRFYFLTAEGLQKLGEASPGGAGRNRTLGLKKLAAVEVPIPALDRQRRFNRLQRQIHEIEAMHKCTVRDVDSLIPILLHREFSAEASTD